MDSPKFLGSMRGHAGAIYALGSSENLLFSGSGDGMLGSWYIDTLKPSPFSVNVGSPIYALATHGDLVIIGQGRGGIHVVDRKAKKELRLIEIHQQGVFDLLVDTENSHLYSAGGKGSIGVFDLDDFRLKIQIPISDKKIRRLAISPDSKKLYIGSSDGYLYIYDTEYMNELAQFRVHDGGVYGIVLDQNGELITTGRDGHIRSWASTSETYSSAWAVPAHNYAVYDISKLSDTTYATASRDKQVKVWSESNWKSPQRLIESGMTTHKSSVNTLLHKNGILFSAGDDQVIKAWEVS